MVPKPFVQSNFERKENDDYQTIDQRCVQGLIEKWGISKNRIVDCCASHGSGIVTALNKFGYIATGCEDAFSDKIDASWIITNPPYKKKLVDEILWKQIDRVSTGEIDGFAALLRAQFDYAKGRSEMFSTNDCYAGQVKLCFRPIWAEPIPGEKKVEPIHNYVWHIWTKYEEDRNEPITRYWYETKKKRRNKIMQKGLFVWDIECDVRWSYHDREEGGDAENYVVVGKNFEEAIAKVKKIVLDKSRSIKEDDEESENFGKIYSPVEITDFTKIERGDWIDG